MPDGTPILPLMPLKDRECPPQKDTLHPGYPNFIEGSPFQQRTRTDIVGHHLHLVKFDTIVSDGAANGWNNIAGARRYETLVERLRKKEDSAYLFSSFVHGDPATPILETYPGDELMIRLVDGAHEEQHSFNITGMSWRKELADPKSPLAAAQTIGVWEAFHLHVTKKYGAGDWIEVTLHNAWDPNHPIPYFSYPRVPLDKEYTPSMRVSLNPQFLQYDPVCDSGINIGYNEMQGNIQEDPGMLLSMPSMK